MMDLAITTMKENGCLTISVSGRLDTTSAPELEKALPADPGGITSLVFDLKDLEYTSSAGLRVFLKAAKLMQRQGDLKLIHVSDPIMEIFEVTGFTDLMTVEGTV